MIKLGCRFKKVGADVFFDRHDDPDNVEYCNQVFLPAMKEYERNSKVYSEYLLLNPQFRAHLTADEKVVLICQDEVIFKTYDDQKHCWCLEGFRALKKKGEGRGIMLSGFTTQQDGFLKLSQEDVDEINRRRADEGMDAMTHLTECGKSRDGYWNEDRMAEQLKDMVSVYEYLYPDHKLVFTFDYSQCHDCLPDDALAAGRMNVGPGGKNQLLNMRPAQATRDYGPGKNYPDGLKAGEFQCMYFQEGDEPPDNMDVETDAGLRDWEAMLATPTLKGMKYIIQEWGLYKVGMTKNGGKERPEFRNQKSKFHEVLEPRGHVCLFSPKYHCELQAVERIWGKSKYYVRKYCKYTWASLKENIPVSLSETAKSPLTRYRFYRKTRDYMRAYREG
ncbi:unnamed protein product, partial [Heterosigma akashiwo]